MNTRHYLAAGAVTVLLFLGGCARSTPVATTLPASTDVGFTAEALPAKFDLRLVDGSRIHGARPIARHRLIGKDFLAVRDCWGCEHLVRIEHIAAMRY